MRKLALAALILAPQIAGARDYSCHFPTECYEAEACDTADFTVELRGTEQQIVTDFGTFPIMALRDEDPILTVFVHAPGAVYLLSSTAGGARFTAHVTEGPQSITYLGTCEAVGR